MINRRLVRKRRKINRAFNTDLDYALDMMKYKLYQEEWRISPEISRRKEAEEMREIDEMIRRMKRGSRSK